MKQQRVASTGEIPARDRRGPIVAASLSTGTLVVVVAVGIGLSIGASPVAAGMPSTQAVTPPHCPVDVEGAATPEHSSWDGPGLLDPAANRVLVCRYAPASTDPLAWRLDAAESYSGARATTLIDRVNAAPPANLNARCPSTTAQELWFVTVGERTVTELRVQLDGCRVVTDGAHASSWLGPDPLSA